jgi:tight adherence protein B
LIRYLDYSLSYKEYVIAFLMASICLFFIGIIFFKSILMAFFFSLFGLFYPKIRSKELMLKRKAELNIQFKQALYILSSSLAAGKSVESAFQESIQDLKMLFPDEQTYIRIEFESISRRLENGESIEKILHDFSTRAGIEDISSFADVFVICKRTGGNMVDVMRNTANIIGEKIAIQQEIAVMISQKRFESKVLTFTPVFFVAILSYTSADYMAPLYQGKGTAVMVFALLLLILCYLINKKIMDIKV